MEMSTAVLNDMWKTIQDHGIRWDVIWSQWVFDSFLSGVAKYLAMVKGDTPQAVVLKDKKDEVVFGALCEKQTNEEASGFTLSYFFGNKELPKDATVTSVSDPSVMQYIKGQCMQAHNLFFYTPETKDKKSYIYDILVIIVDRIKEFFKINLPLDPNVTLTLENFFTIKGLITEPDGKVELTLTPSETLKQIVKEDSVIEQ